MRPYTALSQLKERVRFVYASLFHVGICPAYDLKNRGGNDGIRVDVARAGLGSPSGDPDEPAYLCSGSRDLCAPCDPCVWGVLCDDGL